MKGVMIINRGYVVFVLLCMYGGLRNEFESSLFHTVNREIHFLFYVREKKCICENEKMKKPEFEMING